MRILALFLAFMGLAPMAARAVVVNVDVGAVDLQLPPDYCPLTRDNPIDKVRYEQQDRAQQGASIVLLIVVPCAELAGSRDGSALQHWGIWGQLASAGQALQLPTGKTRKEALDEINAAVPSLNLKEIEKRVGQNIKQDGVEIKLNTMGVLSRDDVGLYAGIVGDASNGTVKRTFGGVLAWSVLRNRFFAFTLYKEFEGVKTFDELLPVVRSVVARSTAASEGKR